MLEKLARHEASRKSWSTKSPPPHGVGAGWGIISGHWPSPVTVYEKIINQIPVSEDAPLFSLSPFAVSAEITNLSRISR